jgi:hypothetical protein
MVPNPIGQVCPLLRKENTMTTVKVVGQCPKLRRMNGEFVTVVGGHDGYSLGSANVVLDGIYGTGPFIVTIDDDNGGVQRFEKPGTRFKITRKGDPRTYTITEVTLPD